jgi:hypothetical protein
MTTTVDRPLTRPAGARPLLGGQRRGQFALALALITACGLLAMLAVLRAGGRTEVLRVARAVPAGHQLTAADLDITRVTAPSGVAVVAASERNAMVGRTALTNLVPGSLLAPAMLTIEPVPGAGQKMVGLSLEPGDLPKELTPGDRVDVVAGGSRAGAGPETDKATVLAASALVYSVTTTDHTSGEILVSVVVDADRAPDVVSAARDRRLSLVLLSRVAP